MTIRFLTLCAFLILPSGFAQGKAAHGIARVVKGNVQVHKKGTSNPVRLKVGHRVKAGDSIITAKDSRAKIVMVDKNEINVSPDSFVTIERYEWQEDKFDKNVRLKVLFGKIRTKVKQRYDQKENKFEVKTPSAVAGVRGTDFFTSYNTVSNSTKVITFEGSVDFGKVDFTGKVTSSVKVDAGMFSSNTLNSNPSTPEAMPKTELATFDSDSNVIEADSSGGEDKRQPSSNESQKKDDLGANSKEVKNPEAAKGDNNRAPASIDHSPVFMADQDLGTCVDCTPNPIGPTLDLPGPQPNRVRVPDVEACDFCNRVVEDGNTRVNINLVPDSN